MRIIKFRAWDKEAKEMLLWGTDRDSIMQAIPIDCGDEWTERCEVMQYTGLNDKNGKEIFEGDVVKGITHKEPIAERTSKAVVGMVKWGIAFGNPCFYFSAELPKGYRTYPNLLTCEVIGDIYSNPELLKESSHAKE